MVVEKFEIHPSEMAKSAVKSSTMVGQNFEIHPSEMAKNAVKIIHHGWRKFEIYPSEMAKNALKRIMEMIILEGHFSFREWEDLDIACMENMYEKKIWLGNEKFQVTFRLIPGFPGFPGTKNLFQVFSRFSRFSRTPDNHDILDTR